MTAARPSVQPVLYIPHGAGPCFFMDWSPADTWDAMAAYLCGIAATLPARPQAIVLVSAHWLTRDFSVTAGAQPELIYDYYNFPPHTYELRYAAPGAPPLAQEIADLLAADGLRCDLTTTRGFDHGMFIPLKLMFPEADIPVVQLSLRSNLDPVAHVRLGELLQPLRANGVLIVGSGMSFHNMRGYGDPRFTARSKVFDDWLTHILAAAAAERNAALCAWGEAPYARDCHPPRAEEHLLPLMVVAGAAGEDRGHKDYSEQVLETQLSGFRFG